MLQEILPNVGHFGSFNFIYFQLKDIYSDITTMADWALKTNYLSIHPTKSDVCLEQ